MNKFSFERFFRILLLLLVLGAILLLMYRFSNLLGYILIALVISYIFDPIVNKMEAAGISRLWASVIVIFSIIMVLGWFSTAVLPTVGNQIVAFATQLNIENVQRVTATIEREMLIILPFLNEGILIDAVVRMADNLFDFGDIQKTVGNVIGIFTNIFTAALIIPFATFFFLKDGYKLRRQMLEIIPNTYFETTLTIIDKTESRLIRYFRSVLIQCTIVAVLSWILLSYAGLNNALSVGIAIGLANTIPYFGPLIGYILSIVVAILETGDFSLVLYCLLAILVIQVIDNIVLQPLIFSKSADMHPMYILFVILVGAEVAGILGMLLAIPIATIIRIVITEINWSLRNYYVFKTE